MQWGKLRKFGWYHKTPHDISSLFLNCIFFQSVYNLCLFMLEHPFQFSSNSVPSCHHSNLQPIINNQLLLRELSKGNFWCFSLILLLFHYENLVFHNVHLHKSGPTSSRGIQEPNVLMSEYPTSIQLHPPPTSRNYTSKVLITRMLHSKQGEVRMHLVLTMC